MELDWLETSGATEPSCHFTVSCILSMIINVIFGFFSRVFSKMLPYTDLSVV
jgi:hypothetical protein